MKMFKTRVALFGALALLITSGIATSVASAAGPYWRVNGTRLEKGSKPITAVAGVTELKATVLGLSVTIACEAAKAENTSIIGNGTSQGQDSAKAIIFEKCSVVSPKQCALTEGSIKTVEIKSHLVIFTNTAKEERIGDLFEPTAGAEFTSISLKNNGTEKCPFTEPFPVKGKAAAEVKVEGTELATGELVFPTVPITKVKLEGTEETVGLEIGAGNKASFSGNFATKLVSGEKFGAFKT